MESQGFLTPKGGASHPTSLPPCLVQRNWAPTHMCFGLVQNRWGLPRVPLRQPQQQGEGGVVLIWLPADLVTSSSEGPWGESPLSTQLGGSKSDLLGGGKWDAPLS